MTKRGIFRPVEGRWGIDTSMRALIRTAKEVAQVGAGAKVDEGKGGHAGG